MSIRKLFFLLYEQCQLVFIYFRLFPNIILIILLALLWNSKKVNYHEKLLHVRNRREKMKSEDMTRWSNICIQPWNSVFRYRCLFFLLFSIFTVVQKQKYLTDLLRKTISVQTTHFFKFFKSSIAFHLFL